MPTRKTLLKKMKKAYGDLTFGRALKSERLSRDMTLREFSELLGISIPALTDLEKERRIPTSERASKIASFIGEPSLLGSAGLTRLVSQQRT